MSYLTSPANGSRSRLCRSAPPNTSIPLPISLSYPANGQVMPIISTADKIMTSLHPETIQLYWSEDRQLPLLQGRSCYLFLFNNIGIYYHKSTAVLKKKTSFIVDNSINIYILHLAQRLSSLINMQFSFSFTNVLIFINGRTIKRIAY